MRSLSLALLLVTSLAIPGCSAFQSDSVRAQKRYDRYIRQSMRNRERQQDQIKRQRQEELPPSQSPGPAQVEVTTGAAE